MIFIGLFIFDKSKMLKFFCFVVLIFLVSSEATVEETLYIAAWDKNTKTLGQAYSSSGGNFWQTYIKDRGMIGEAASGLRGCRGSKFLFFNSNK